MKPSTVMRITDAWCLRMLVWGLFPVGCRDLVTFSKITTRMANDGHTMWGLYLDNCSKWVGM